MADFPLDLLLDMVSKIVQKPTPMKYDEWIDVHIEKQKKRPYCKCGHPYYKHKKGPLKNCCYECECECYSEKEKKEEKIADEKVSDKIATDLAAAKTEISSLKAKIKAKEMEIGMLRITIKNQNEDIDALKKAKPYVKLKEREEIDDELAEKLKDIPDDQKDVAMRFAQLELD